MNRHVCKISTFVQSLRQTQILILKIPEVFLRLKSSSFLTLNKIESFAKVSNRLKVAILSFLVISFFACGWGRTVTPVPEHLSAGGKQIQKGLKWHQKGCYDRALEHFLRAHELYSASDVVDGVAMSLNNLGSIHKEMGDCDGAVLYFDEAYKTYLYLGKEKDVARTLSNKAAALIAMGNLDGAEQALDKAADMLPKDKDKKIWISIRNNKGVLLTKKREHKEAEKLLADCLKETQQYDSSQSASVNFALGNLMLETDRLEKAASFFAKALESDQRIGFYKGMADDLFYMGLAFSRAGKEKQAIESWKRSAKIYALIGCVNDVNRVMKYLKESSVKHSVNLSLTESFIERWLSGEMYESPCHD
jgi:tetratricopeptide (TPR) repeat protein